MKSKFPIVTVQESFKLSEDIDAYHTRVGMDFSSVYRKRFSREEGESRVVHRYNSPLHHNRTRKKTNRGVTCRRLAPIRLLKGFMV